MASYKQETQPISDTLPKGCDDWCGFGRKHETKPEITLYHKTVSRRGDRQLDPKVNLSEPIPPAKDGLEVFFVPLVNAKRIATHALSLDDPLVTNNTRGFGRAKGLHVEG